MIVNMYEYKIIFGHQFVNAIQNVTFTVIQPRRMFKKGVMVDVQEFIILVCSCALGTAHYLSPWGGLRILG